MGKMKRILIVGFTSISILCICCSPNAEAAKEKRVIEGTISGYECGDNCYLTIKDKNGKERTGLCVASPLCDQWNEKTSMPGSFKGKKVKVSVEKGKQLDAEGNEMGSMDAFTTIQLSK